MAEHLTVRLLWGDVAWLVCYPSNDEATAPSAPRAGADDCLAWPCSRIELQARVRAVLRRRRQ